MTHTPKTIAKALSFFGITFGMIAVLAFLAGKPEAPAKVEIGPAPYDQPLADLIARTLYTEAAGEGMYGKYLVASVIWNRAGGDPAKLKQVITKPKQFSHGRPVEDDAPSRQAWADCALIAEQMVTGTFMSVTTATYFYSSRPPYWAASMEVTEVEGGHTFLREKQHDNKRR